MTEDGWNDLLNELFDKLAARTRAECATTATSSEISDKLG